VAEKLGRQDKKIEIYLCALDLIQNSRLDPETRDNPNNFKEVVHRFSGKTKDGQIFCVQIKKGKKIMKNTLFQFSLIIKKTSRWV